MDSLVAVDDIEHAQHRLVGKVGLELHLSSDPRRTFFGDGFLRELVAQFDFEFRTIEVSLTVELGDEELPLLLLLLLPDKGRGGEDKAQFFHVLQLVLQGFEGIDGEGGCRYRHLGMSGQLVS